MLASVELPADFKLLNRQFQGLAQALLDEIELQPVRHEVASTQDGNFRGFDPARFYVIESGTISVRYADRTVYLLEEGDLLLPDAAGTGDVDAAVYYGSEAGASLNAFSALEFMAEVLSRPATTKLWTRLLVTYTGMMLRLTAMQTPVDVPLSRSEGTWLLTAALYPASLPRTLSAMVFPMTLRAVECIMSLSENMPRMNPSRPSMTCSTNFCFTSSQA